MHFHPVIVIVIVLLLVGRNLTSNNLIICHPLVYVPCWHIEKWEFKKNAKSRSSHIITAIQTLISYSLTIATTSCPKSKTHLSTFGVSIQSLFPFTLPILSFYAELYKLNQKKKKNVSLPTILSKPILTPESGNRHVKKPRLPPLYANQIFLQSSVFFTNGLFCFTWTLIHPYIFSSTPGIGWHLGSLPLQGVEAVCQWWETGTQEAWVFLKLYASDSSPALAIKATIEKTKCR